MAAHIRVLELSQRVSNKTQLACSDVRTVMVSTFAEIAAALESGQEVFCHGLGRFKLIIKKQRIGRNPKKPEDEVIIPEHLKIKFCPLNPLGNKIKKLPVK